MISKGKWLVSFVAFLMAALVPSQMALAQPNLGAQIADALSDTGEIHLGLFNQGERDGFMRLGWIKSEESVLLYDRSMMPSREVYERLALTLASDLSFRSGSIDFYSGTAILGLTMAATDGQIEGERSVWRIQGSQTSPFSLDLPDGTLPRAAAFLMPLVLPLQEGEVTRFQWYAPLANSIAPITLTQRDGGSIETPAGVFETMVFEVRGGAPDNDIYVTRSTPRRIVRIDVVGTELRFFALPEPNPAE